MLGLVARQVIQVVGGVRGCVVGWSMSEASSEEAGEGGF